MMFKLQIWDVVLEKENNIITLPFHPLERVIVALKRFIYNFIYLKQNNLDL